MEGQNQKLKLTIEEQVIRSKYMISGKKCVGKLFDQKVLSGGLYAKK